MSSNARSELLSHTKSTSFTYLTYTLDVSFTNILYAFMLLNIQSFKKLLYKIAASVAILSILSHVKILENFVGAALSSS
jgi:hypothetical protein